VGNIKIESGYSANGLPCVRLKGGTRSLVIFEGLNFNHTPPSGQAVKWSSGMYSGFTGRYSVYILGRKPGLPQGYSIKQMADDYAVMLKNELTPPVDLIGLSTGGAIALQFALDYPELVSHLVLASAGYRLSAAGAAAQRKVMESVRQGRWRAAAAAMAGVMVSGPLRPLAIVFFWLMGKGMFGSPSDPSDGLAELEAEDRFDFADKMQELQVPALVIGGEKDRFYPLRETAAGIPSARLLLYKNAGHMSVTRRSFSKDVLAFLTEAQ
jgi:pimeloyl-ACP methyl ester carboxylesterase